MAELKSSEVKYGVPLRTAVGDLFLTATKIEFPASAETVTGGVELNPTKLGLTVGAVAGAQSAAAAQGNGPDVGELAATTALPPAVWTSGVAVTASQAAKGEAITSAVPVVVTQEAGKIFLRFLAVPTLKKDWVEITTAEKANGVVGLCELTVFTLGK